MYSSNVEPADTFKKAIKLQNTDEVHEHLESSWILYLTNTGGQIEFQEQLPYLACGSSIHFVIFPLHKDLNKPYEGQYQCADGEIKTYKSDATLMEELLQLLSTINVFNRTTYEHKHTESNARPTCKIFFIGTHRDCLLETEVEKQIDTIDEQLQKCVKHTSLFS